MFIKLECTLLRRNLSLYLLLCFSTLWDVFKFYGGRNGWYFINNQQILHIDHTRIKQHPIDPLIELQTHRNLHTPHCFPFIVQYSNFLLALQQIAVIGEQVIDIFVEFVENLAAGHQNQRYFTAVGFVLGVSEKEGDVSAVAEIGVEVPEIGSYVEVEYCCVMGITGLHYFFMAAEEKCLDFDYVISGGERRCEGESESAVVVRVFVWELGRQHFQIQIVYNSNLL